MRIQIINQLCVVMYLFNSAEKKRKKPKIHFQKIDKQKKWAKKIKQNLNKNWNQMQSKQAVAIARETR